MRFRSENVQVSKTSPLHGIVLAVLPLVAVGSAFFLGPAAADTTQAAGSRAGTPPVRDTPTTTSLGSPRSGATRPSTSRRPRFDRVVVISIDGMRADMVGAGTRNLLKMKREGAWASQAFTIRRSTTLPSHAAMLSGYDVERHGLSFNAFRPSRGGIQVPTVFKTAEDAGLPTAMIVGKRKLMQILHAGNTAHFDVPGGRCTQVAAAAVQYLSTNSRGFTFVHFAEPDSAGHRIGWLTPGYVAAVHNADSCAGTVMRAIHLDRRRARTLVIATADHGGHGRGHGGGSDIDRHIPWIAHGPGVGRRELREEINTRDTAATAIWALGLQPPSDIEGHPLTTVFDASGAP